MTVFRNNVKIDGTLYGEFVATVAGAGSASAAVPGTPAKTPSSSGPSTLPPGVLPDPAAMDRLMGGAATQGFLDPRKSHEGMVKRVAKGYEEKVVGILDVIASGRTGQAVLRAIGLGARSVTIIPWLGGSKDSPNASESAKHYQAATARGRLLRGEGGKLLHPIRSGTGQGSEATVKFLPSIFAKAVQGADPLPEAVAPPPGIMQDEALLHELVHAMEDLAGRLVRRGVPFQSEYTDWGEWFAILIVNIYRSERKLPLLRRSHQGFKAYEIHPYEFVRVGLNRMHLRQFRRRYPMLFREIRESPAVFNPLRAIRDAGGEDG